MIKSHYKNFGDYLLDNRQKCNMSAAQLAETIGVSRAEISRIETGDRKEPSLKILRATTGIFKDDIGAVTDFILRTTTSSHKRPTSKKSANA